MTDKDKVLIFDTETTGTREPIVAVEAAWLSLELKIHESRDCQSVELVQEFEQRYKPGKPIELGAMATHHILDDELADCPPASSFKLPPGTRYLIGHNVDYDWKVIGEPPVRRICTLALSRWLFPDIDAHSQSAMLYFFAPNKDTRTRLKDAHSALADVRNCGLLLKDLLKTLYERDIIRSLWTWEDIWRISETARIPTVMNFGQHKGTAIPNLPADYIRWLLGQSDLDPYLRKALTARKS